MKIARKLIGLLLAAAMILGLVPFTGRTEVHAAGVIETHDAAYIKELLEGEGDVSIKLDDHADYSMTTAATEWCELGSGVKTLDLNGYDLHIKQEKDLDGRTFTMIKIYSGATLIVNDSSGSNKGELVANGYIGKWVRGTAGSHRAAFYNDEVLYRDIIAVNGGKLIFNGGKITAGRKKSQYTGYSVEEGWFEETLSMFSSGTQNFVGFNVRHDGDVDKIINGSGIKVYNGEAIINGGIVQGRGFSKLEMTNEDNRFGWEMKTNAAIKAEGGRIVINNGYIEGLSCAGALGHSHNSEAEIIIRGGIFETHKNSKILIPVIREYFSNDRVLFGGSLLSICPIYVDGWYGGVGVEDSYIDSENTEIEKDDHKVEVTPKKHKLIDLYNETYGAEVGDSIEWDGTSDVILSADIIPYWPAGEIPYNQTKGNGLIHYFGALAQSSKELGITSAISIGGMTVSEGGETTAVEKRLSQSAMVDYEHMKLSFNLKDLLPDGLNMGDSFLVSVRWADILYNSENDPSLTMTYRNAFTVQLTETDIEIVKNPGNKTGAIDSTVTLSAQADNAAGAIWECVYPISEMLDGNFDNSTGEATLDVKVESIRKRYVCHFSNGSGQKTTSAAIVMPPVTGGGIETEGTVTEVTWWKSNSFNHIIPGGTITADIKQIKSAVRWYYGTDSSDVNQLIEPDAHIGTEIGTGDLVAQNVVDEDAGYYRVEYDYEANDGTETLRSGLYHVTVLDVPDDTEISEVTIYGLEDLHVGDIAPEAADLYTDDARVKVSDIDWGSISAGDKIKSDTLTVKITLTRTSDKVKWALNSDGKFIGYIGNGRQATAEMAPGDGPITVSYSYSNTNPIPTPQENVVVTGCLKNGEVVEGTSFALTEGEEVDITFDYYVQESARPQPSGVSHVTGLIAGGLPDGLTFEYDAEGDAWHIRGTLTQAAQFDPIVSPITFSLQDDDGKDTGTKIVLFRFIITPKIKGMSLPVRILDLFHEHEYGEWTDAGDGATHIHICSGCGNEEAQPHSWDDGVVTTEATGTAEGVMTYTCQVCGATRTEPVEKHSIVMTEEVPADCTIEGSKPHYECEDCGMAFEDAEGTKQITDMSLLQIPLTDHTWGEWTEDDGETHSHVYTVCLAKESEEHKWDSGKVTKEATTEAEGVKTYTCTDCGATKTESVPKKVTITYDVGEGIKGEDWVDTFDVDYGYKLEAGKIIPPDEALMKAPDDMEFAGVERDGVTYLVGDDASEYEIVKDITIKYLWKAVPFEYTVISAGTVDGEAGSWTKGSGADYEIVVKRSNLDEKCFTHFTGVKLDDTELVKDTDYTAKAGSTVITLKGAVLEKLEAGEHNVTAVFEDGEVTSTVTIAEKKQEESSASEESSAAEESSAVEESSTAEESSAAEESSESSKPESSKAPESSAESSKTNGSPNTGDNSRAGIWIAVFMSSMIVLAGALVVYKKRRNA